MKGIYWDSGVDLNQNHMWNMFPLVKTVLFGDKPVKGEGRSLNAEVSWVGGSWSLRNTGPELPYFIPVDMVQNKELALGYSCREAGMRSQTPGLMTLADCIMSVLGITRDQY